MQNQSKQFGEHIFRIKIPTPFAVGPVFSYLIKDEKVVLIDCGQYEERAFTKVELALREQGLTVKDIDEIWLTHAHPDHFGQAARLADKAGAVILGHRKEEASFSGYNNRDLFVEFFNSHGIPQQVKRKMIEQLDWLEQYQQAVSPKWIEDGEQLSSGKLQFKVQHTPGHAAGHLVFAERDGMIIGGDLLLKHITTNALINFDPDTGQRNRSLLQYRDSLQWLAGQSGQVLPGHGVFIKEISRVAEHHLAEHSIRYSQVVQLLNQGPLSLLDLSLRLFPKAMKQGDTFLVFSEVMGYLDWGMEKGEIYEIQKGSIRYAL
ncbi:MBL fold metallo-hydrolase [Aliifodinibius sp. S!AR15-10]|uniref:MBL fold metallo-hydrolase n=1 Tax=Aliifodinibius sp. S!AR15-10 TaxID=2950437 RepID=UPI00285BFFB2|nr:MBL fold metallo-hydrolase [Aliifodinibius sp. S!AR15-10]MDR8392451.1 MBL fold metallo-hydrolase [Aliifodinibius sp. S!AR15-10]